MKRFSFSDSSGKLLYPTEEKNTENLGYSNEFQAMLDGLEDEDGIEESGCGTGKKRRLRVDQVQALEKIFEVDNKLDPDRKVKIAQEIGLQPRQIAIWFQNRRARWKTKQLERDYNILKSNYEALQHNYTKVEHEKEGLLTELKGLKEKLGEETLLSPVFQRPQEILNKLKNSSDFVDSKDGSSDSDSSGVMNEENYNISTLKYQQLMPKVSSYNNALDHLSLSSSTYTQLMDPRASNSTSSSMRAYNNNNNNNSNNQQQQQGVGRIEEQNGFTTEDSCNIYSVDQAPNLYWYFSDHRN